MTLLSQRRESEVELSGDPQFTVDLLRRLVQIDSVNPTLVTGGKGEQEIASFVAQLLSDEGIETRFQEVAPGRPNVLGRVRGSGEGRTLILNAHLDTVSVEGMDDPFSGKVEDGRLFGRGAWDTKAGLTAGIIALLALKSSKSSLRGDVVLVGAVDEEYASLGTQALLEDTRADGCIILEPTGLDLWVAHGGFSWVEVETYGIAAHGSLPHEGVDAITKMGLFLTELEELRHRLHREKSFQHPLGGDRMHPSLHASIIEGGREWSSYPDRCLLRLERRMIPSETTEEVEAELEGLVLALEARDSQFRAAKRTTMVRPPWQVEPGPLLVALEEACEEELGGSPSRVTGLMWTDAALTQQAGIPSVIFGPRGEGKHGLVEWVDTDSVIACARVLVRTALEFCNRPA